MDQCSKDMARGIYADEQAYMTEMVNVLNWPASIKNDAIGNAVKVINIIRRAHNSGLMESLLAEYGLSTDEGVAVMCLAEAYLRRPDAGTLDALITDKIGDSDWARHVGHAKSSLVNASTWALMLMGRV